MPDSEQEMVEEEDNKDIVLTDNEDTDNETDAGIDYHFKYQYNSDITIDFAFKSLINFLKIYYFS